MRTSTAHKIKQFKKATFLLVVLTLINYACTADAVLIDTSLKLPPVPLNTEGL